MDSVVEYTWCEDDDYPAVIVDTVIIASGGNAVLAATDGLTKIVALHHERFQREEAAFREALDFCVVELETWLCNARERGKELL